MATGRFLIWTAISVIVAQVGCATRGLQMPAISPRVTLSDADRLACQDFAQAEAARALDGWNNQRVGKYTNGSIFKMAWVGIFIDPTAWIVLPIMLRQRHHVQTQAYDQALEVCLAPPITSPEHRDVLQRLRDLANRYTTQGAYAKAEPLYHRVLVIQEQTSTPNDPEVAVTLDGYANLLRQTQRESQAAELESRARAIRASAETIPPQDPADEPKDDRKGTQ